MTLQPGQIQQGSQVIDTKRVTVAVAGVNGDDPVTGLWDPDVRANDEPRASADGVWPGPRHFDARHVSVPVLATDKALHAAVLRSQFSTLASRDLLFCGFGWGDDTYRLGALPATGGKSQFTSREGKGDVWLPTLEWDCPDPTVYSYAPQTATISPGSTATLHGAGAVGSRRVQITFTGPWVGPGVTSNLYGGRGLVFPGLELLSGQEVIAYFDPWGTYGFGFLGSPTILEPILWANAMGVDDAAYPISPWHDDQPPVLPGDQVWTATGTGAGSMSVSWHDAWRTPP